MVASSMQYPSQQQGHQPAHLQRPSSIVQYSQAPAPPHSGAYAFQPSPTNGASTSGQDHQVSYPAYPSHQTQYSTPGTSSPYAAAGDGMATVMPLSQQQQAQARPPYSQYGSQANAPSPHEQRNMYQFYPAQQQQYSHPAPPYQQPATMNYQMHHAPHQAQHPQAAMTPSPRNTKVESLPSRMPGSSGPVGMSNPAQAAANGQGLSTPTGASNTTAVNANAAPGPIPATTPLVVRQDNNGVQWIAFEYSRDRVKMEYTIRCDVESVQTDELMADFKTENCVYPRACCPKESYRGNRLQYETECNTVGWALASLNPCLRGKRGLIQRAVDSWRNSNQDPRLRSRRVRRMAKMTSRKGSTPHSLPPHSAAGMSPGGMGPGSATAMVKPGLSIGSMHHHHEGTQGGDEVGDEYMEGQHHHHHQAPPQSDERPAHVFSAYGSYPNNPAHNSSSLQVDDTGASPHGGTVTARRSTPRGSRHDEPDDLFPNIPEAKKRKFILVDDSDRSSRLRVRVTLDTVDTREIPDSFRKGSSVYPRSYFPREMQSPPPSATGSKFFTGDLSDLEDDGSTDTEGRRRSRGYRERELVKVHMVDTMGEVAIPRMRRTTRGKEVRLNDLGYRMAWLQSRVFAGRTIFLQRARESGTLSQLQKKMGQELTQVPVDCYRNKTKAAIETIMHDVRTAAPHYETRVGKRKWNERTRRGEKEVDEEMS